MLGETVNVPEVVVAPLQPSELSSIPSVNVHEEAFVELRVMRAFSPYMTPVLLDVSVAVTPVDVVCVVADTAGLDEAETLFAASKALMTYEYVVAGVNPESVNASAEVVDATTPSLMTRYPATPTSSTAAPHVRLIALDDTAVAVTAYGANGG
jgi:hypothetical protein